MTGSCVVFKRGEVPIRAFLVNGEWEWVFMRRHELRWLVSMVRIMCRDRAKAQRLYDFQERRRRRCYSA